MLRQKWGRIVNVSSAVALHGNAGQTVYAATKAGLVGMTRSLAREVAMKGVTVNAICPGLLDTDKTSHLDDAPRAYYIDQTPLQRPARAPATHGGSARGPRRSPRARDPSASR